MVRTDGFSHLSRVYPSPVDMAPPSSVYPMDTLSTLKEVSSNPPSPDISPSTAFPQLVVSPPLCGHVCHNMEPCGKGEGAEPQNGLHSSPIEEIQDSLRYLRDMGLSFTSPMILLFLELPLTLTVLVVFPGAAPLFVIRPPTWALRCSAGTSRIAPTAHEVASSPSNSPGSCPKGRSEAFQAQRV